MGLVKTRRLAAMHPPSPRLRRTGKQQRAKARLKPAAKGGKGVGVIPLGTGRATPPVSGGELRGTRDPTGAAD